MFTHVISVNILIFLLSSTISTLNQFEMTVNLSDEEISRNDVIWCELNRLTFIDLIRSVYAKTTLSVDRRLYKKRYCDDANLIVQLSQIIVAKRAVERFESRWASYSISSAARNWTNLFLINDLIKSSAII